MPAVVSDFPPISARPIVATTVHELPMQTATSAQTAQAED